MLSHILMRGLVEGNPQLKSGLAMSPREFVTSLRFRLGIPVFPAPHTQSVVCAVMNWTFLVTMLLAVVFVGLSDMMPYVTSSSTGCS